MGHDDTAAGSVDVSVIMPAHNAQDSIGEQLLALAAQETDISFEVIVVLNRCSDDTSAIVESFRDRLNIRAIIADKQASAAYARNVGVHQSLTPLLLFCDADDRVGTHWVSALHESLQEADFAGGRLVIDLENMPRWRRPASGAHPINGGLHTWDGRLLYPITASFGCRRDPFLSVGGFDESFAGATSEDIDLALRLYRAGFTMGFAQDAELLYRPRRSLRQMLKQTQGYAQGDALLAAKEGRLIPVGRLRGVGQVGLNVAHKAVVQRVSSPRALYLSAAEFHYRLDARRRMASREDLGPQEANPIVDYGVAAKRPGATWFALSDRRDRARHYFREQPDVDVLNLIATRVQAGDTIIDLEPNGGAVAITASRTVGVNGSVWSCEPSGPNRQLLQHNTARHGCEEIVRVVEVFDVTSIIEGVVLVRFDRDQRALRSVDDYRRLIEMTPQAAYIVPSELVGQNHSWVTDHFFSSGWRMGQLPLPDGAADADLSHDAGPQRSDPGVYFLAERAD